MPRSERHLSYSGPDDETGCRPGLWCSDPYARIAVAAGAFLAGTGLGGGRSGLADDEDPGGKAPATLRSPALPGRLGWPGCPRCRRSGGDSVMTGAIAGARPLAPDPRNAIN